MHIIYVSYVWWNENTKSAPRSCATIGPDRRSCVPWGSHANPMGIPLGQAAPRNREGAQCGNSETESLGPDHRTTGPVQLEGISYHMATGCGEFCWGRIHQKCEERLLYTSVHCLHTLWNFDTVHFFLTCDHPLLWSVSGLGLGPDDGNRMAFPIPETGREMERRLDGGWMMAHAPLEVLAPNSQIT